RQRIMIAMAISNRPELLIADEPTTALDVTVQSQIVELIAELQRETGMAVAFISHDLNLVRRLADRVVVMRGGSVVEAGATDRIFSAPEAAYTRLLLDAEPTGHKVPPPRDAQEIIGADNLSVAFQRPRRLFRPRPAPLTAVDHISLSVRQGETLGIVGESGSGKSTLGRALFRLVSAEGRIRFQGREISDLTRRAMKPLRRDMQVVFQDPFGSLSPRMMVGEIVAEGLRVHEPQLSARERDHLAAKALADMQIDPVHRFRFPHEFSGGQRQRIAIARALILRPGLILLDEPTSALDRTVQKEIVTLLRDVQARDGLTYLFISHDLAVVRALADHILVMRAGRIVETGSTEDVIRRPREAYTQDLMRAAFATGSVRLSKRDAVG
ncbi:MAG: ATP-binding cassette domain-containing protein, partial [Proteobacteria bacterium]|nr:ATP-binding cassette domain-containing protein [Pseudomonadota bacterium]